MELPTSFAAGERAFSSAGHMQSVLRIRLSYERLHCLLFIYFNSRSLPDADLHGVDLGDDGGAISEESSDGEAGGSVGSDASVADIDAVAPLLADEMDEQSGQCVASPNTCLCGSTQCAIHIASRVQRTLRTEEAPSTGGSVTSGASMLCSYLFQASPGQR